jgi:hypothetical protein
MNLKNIPKDDFLWGSLFGAIVIPYTWDFRILISLIGCIVLWIIGGQLIKGVRRIGCPILVTVILWQSSVWIIIPTLISFGLLSIGYGIKSINDEGSPYGNFWLKITGKDDFLTTFLARGTLILGCHLAYFIYLKVF